MKEPTIEALQQSVPRLQDCTITPLTGGFSADRKYLVAHPGAEHLVLRVSSLEQSRQKTFEYDVLGIAAGLPIRCTRPVEFGQLPALDSCYMLVTFVEGEDATVALPRLTSSQQYEVGRQAGIDLARLHQVPSPQGTQPWAERMRQKHARNLAAYHQCGVSFPNDERIVAYVEERLGLLDGRPNQLQHGDFHVGNIIVRNGEYAGVIDFNRCDWGDPYEEYYKLGMFSREVSVPFCVGQLHGYFGGEPPVHFWKLYALYSAFYVLPSITWTLRVVPGDIDGMLERLQRILDDHDGFRQDVPIWYTRLIGNKDQ